MSNTETKKTKGFTSKFFKALSDGSVLLMLATFAAVLWANVSEEGYSHFWHTHFSVGFGDNSLDMTLHHWINDGLMAIFFFVVGLEIKREFLAGELNSIKKASLPIFAAIGGMVIPIAFFMMFGLEGTASHGWGVPMATDIAFSLGILAMLGSRVPLSLKVFLTALAIVDDLGAVVVIAIFYGGALNMTYVWIAAALIAILMFANYKNIQDLRLYTILGTVVWYLVLMSGTGGPGTGLHATIAGVLVAFTIPARPKVHIDKFIPSMVTSLSRFRNIPRSTHEIVLSNKQMHAIEDVEYSVKKVRSPLQYIEHQFHDFISRIILPLFALANAGVVLKSGHASEEILSTISLAIAVSLVFGKAIGISLFSWLACKLKIAEKPKNTSWSAFIGLGLLGGIGFTMSIFIASLAYADESKLLNEAKLGIFIGSIVAGFAGFYMLKSVLNKKAKK